MEQPTSLRELFETANRIQSFPRGSVIIQKYGNVDYSYFLASGLVKIYDIDGHGNKRTVAITAGGQIFPLSWLIDANSDTGSRYFYEALTEIKCYVLGRQELREYFYKHPELSFKMMRDTAGSYFNALARITNLEKSNVAERVEFILVYLAKLYGKPDKGTIVKISAHITHQEIADLAGLSREAVSLQLRKPKYRSIYSKHDGTIYIDANKLDMSDMPEIYVPGQNN